MNDLKTNNLPRHIAIIMDGNGRWAKHRGKPRLFGHRAGATSMKKIVIATAKMGIEYLTVYAFSTENWKRSTEEVSGLFKLIIQYVASELNELIDANVHINVIGDYKKLPDASVKALDKMIDKTKYNDGLKFNIAINYGGRDDITRAVNQIIREREINNLSSKTGKTEITEDDISKHLYTGKMNFDIPDPDLLIRTSGEQRLSNFLIWQSSYSELIFTKTLWPDFDEEEYRSLIEAYSNRDRRYGGIKEEIK